MKVLEFFSGIGGLRLALEDAIQAFSFNRSRLWFSSNDDDDDEMSNVLFNNFNLQNESIEVVEAYDINQNANLVYHHYFNQTPITKNIENLDIKNIDGKSTCWILSPPCQPYTISGLQKQSMDNRSTGFHHLLNLLEKCVNPPVYFFLENVKGFHGSDSHSFMMKILTEKGYHLKEFLLSPTQFGIPNTRVRYYCYGILRKDKKPLDNSQTTMSQNPNQLHYNVPDETLKLLLGVKPKTMIPIIHYLDIDDENSDFIIPSSILLKYSSFRFDVVDDLTTASTTVTKAYGKLIGKSGPVTLYRQTGKSGFESNRVKRNRDENLTCGSEQQQARHNDESPRNNKFEFSLTNKRLKCNSTRDIYVTNDHQFTHSENDEQISIDWKIHINETHKLCPQRLRLINPSVDLIRWLTDKELLRLHGFPPSFSFPSQLQRNQRYALIGNSINVTVVSLLLVDMLRSHDL